MKLVSIQLHRTKSGQIKGEVDRKNMNVYVCVVVLRC